MRGPAETQRGLLPDVARQIRGIAWRHHLDWMASIARAPITPAQKLLAGGVTLRMMVGSRRTLAKEALSLLRPPVPIRPRSAPVGVGLYGMYRSANLGDWAISAPSSTASAQSLGQTRFVGICADPDDARTTSALLQSDGGVSARRSHPTARS